MSVFDKLMSSMRIDNEFEDDQYIDDEYEYDDRPRKSIFNSKKEEDYDYYEEPERSIGLFGGRKSNPAPTPVRRSMEVSLFKPTSVADSKEITDYLLEGKAVVLNMEGIRTDIAQRIIDFTCGATYAMDGKLQKISNFIFIATPSNVDLSGDFQDMIAGNFDVTQNTFKM